MSKREELINLMSAYGDGFYDGFLAALKYHDMKESDSESEAMRLSEIAENECSFKKQLDLHGGEA